MSGKKKQERKSNTTFVYTKGTKKKRKNEKEEQRDRHRADGAKHTNTCQ